MSAGVCGGQRPPLELEFEAVVSCLMWVLRSKLRSKSSECSLWLSHLSSPYHWLNCVWFPSATVSLNLSVEALVTSEIGLWGHDWITRMN